MRNKHIEDVILNEVIYSEYMLGARKSIRVNIAIVKAIYTVARYLYQRGGMTDKKEITERLVSMVKALDRNGETKGWNTTILKAVDKKNLVKPLVEISYIGVTEAELSTINSINGIMLQKIAFTLLLLAKYKNLCNPNNDNWENYDISSVFKYANVKAETSRRYELIYKLNSLGLIRLSSMVLNTNIRVNFINNDSEEKLRVGDFRDLGFVYMHHIGKDFNICPLCGRLFEYKKGSKNVYCPSCRQSFRSISSNNLYIPIEERPFLTECACCGEPTYINPKVFWLNQICPNCEEK